jgi:hypothetical protein
MLVSLCSSSLLLFSEEGSLSTEGVFGFSLIPDDVGSFESSVI